MSYKVTTSEADQPKKCGCHCQEDTPQKDVSYNHETGEATVHPGNPDCPCSCQVEEYIEQYQAMTAAAEKAKEAAEAAKDDYVQKSGMLNTLAKQATLVTKAAAILEAIANIHVDVPDNFAMQEDVTAATNAILAAIGLIDFSALAKQGSNSNISLTSMDEKLGDFVKAANIEYAAFKSHVATEIANILTPITEE